MKIFDALHVKVALAAVSIATIGIVTVALVAPGSSDAPRTPEFHCIDIKAPEPRPPAPPAPPPIEITAPAPA